MKISNAKFITSVADKGHFYKTDKPVIAVAGKSNVGKSSLINMLAGNKKLARTSVTPGRTRLINYFDFGDFVLVDLPGYGFAKVSREEKLKWAELLETYLQTERVDLMISLVDIRHEPTEDDKMLQNYFYAYTIPFVTVATKADKLSKMKIKESVQKIATALKLGVCDITPVSSETGYNKEAVLKLIENAVNNK